MHTWAWLFSNTHSSCFHSFKVVHVEHDKVATHVHRHNHDSSYNSELEDDGIEHVCVPKFEHVEEDLDAFMKVHGRK
jgi:site-specific DNA-cytosine methylase